MLRLERGLTQQQLADITGISREHVSKLENGKREAGLRVLENLATSLDKTLSDLMKGV